MSLGSLIPRQGCIVVAVAVAVAVAVEVDDHVDATTTSKYQRLG
jgi:hypothetical protein